LRPGSRAKVVKIKLAETVVGGRRKKAKCGTVFMRKIGTGDSRKSSGLGSPSVLRRLGKGKFRNYQSPMAARMTDPERFGDFRGVRIKRTNSENGGGKILQITRGKNLQRESLNWALLRPQTKKGDGGLGQKRKSDCEPKDIPAAGRSPKSSPWRKTRNGHPRKECRLRAKARKILL